MFVSSIFVLVILKPFEVKLSMEREFCSNLNIIGCMAGVFLMSASIAVCFNLLRHSGTTRDSARDLGIVWCISAFAFGVTYGVVCGIAYFFITMPTIFIVSLIIFAFQLLYIWIRNIRKELNEVKDINKMLRERQNAANGWKEESKHENDENEHGEEVGKEVEKEADEDDDKHDGKQDGKYDDKHDDKHDGKQDKEECPVILHTDNTSQDFTIIPSKIIYVESVGNYSNVYYIDNEHISSRTLRSTIKQLKEELRDYSFIVQCHRAFLVNLMYVESLEGTNNRFFINLFSLDKKIPLSRPNRAAIKEAICASSQRNSKESLKS